MADCLIGLGSNVGERAWQLEQAVERFCDHALVTHRATSQFLETPPIGGPTGQEAFLNAALRVETELSPGELLDWVAHVEGELGRQRIQRWGPRGIDIDVLLYDQVILTSEALTLPHPRMAIRRFVLEPACEVAEEMIHAPTGHSIRQLLDRLTHGPCYVATCGVTEGPSRQLIDTMAAGTAEKRPRTTPLYTSSRDNAAWLTEAAWMTENNHAPPNLLAHALSILTEERELLASIATNDTPNQLVVSDFWLNRWLAFARLLTPGEEREQLQQACSAALRSTPQPRFVLFLDNPDAASRPVPPAPPHSSSPQDDSETRPDVAHALRQQLAEPSGVPVLFADARDLPAALIELQAGVDATR